MSVSSTVLMELGWVAIDRVLNHNKGEKCSSNLNTDLCTKPRVFRNPLLDKREPLMNKQGK